MLQATGVHTFRHAPLHMQDMNPPSDNLVSVRVLQDAGVHMFSFGPLGLHEGALVGGGHEEGGGDEVYCSNDGAAGMHVGSACPLRRSRVVGQVAGAVFSQVWSAVRAPVSPPMQRACRNQGRFFLTLEVAC